MRLPLLLAALALSACGTKSVTEIDNDEDGVFGDVDCDDADPEVGAPSTWYGDADGDGHAGDLLSTEACAQPGGYFAEVTDCDDLDPSVSPDGVEVCNGGVDDDCDGLADADDDDVDPSSYLSFYQDQDGDGYGADEVTAGGCEAPGGYVAEAGDCDDLNPSLNPETVWYQDLDSDGFGATEFFTQACEQPDGYLADAGDCDDLDRAVNPDAIEVCNEGVDDNCDGYADDADAEVDLATATEWYADLDGDGYGDPDSTPTLACAAPSGTSSDFSDCDDSTAAANPGETEVCGDGIDNDCDGTPNTCGLPSNIAVSDADLLVVGPTGENTAWESTVADFNGDGYPDLATASYYYNSLDGDSYAGLTHVIYGPLSTDVSAYADMDAGFYGDDSSDYSGKTLASGDFNGDGTDDLLISAYQDDNNGTSSGSVFLLYGDSASPWTGSASLSDAADASWVGTATSDYLGLVVRGMGDLDGDGYDDFAMGSDSFDVPNSNGGAVFFFRGGSSEYSGLDQDPTNADLIVAGAAASDYLGDYRSVAAPGDLDGDGYDDFLLGATSADPTATSSGAVWVGYGDSLSTSLFITTSDLSAIIGGEAASDYLGDGIAAAGDVDNDGYPDFLAGADGNDDGASAAGKVYLFLGGAARYVGAYVASDATATFTGLNSSDYLGEGVAGLDINNDGYSDVVMGADGYDTPSGSSIVSSAGAAYLFYGPVSGSYSVSDADFEMVGLESSGYLGQDLQVGDLNGDGRDDLLVSAYGADTIGVMFGALGL
ncbi:MAG: FG-GAP repeat protein [Alphaproteobacteria bacterium]|nr:FG-GAP repeat protein [Alphaproteobacteria bacterium]MCB9793388.1 FG-GAP repeat protein [Alphaproteobacteria bacterium]